MAKNKTHPFTTVVIPEGLDPLKASRILWIATNRNKLSRIAERLGVNPSTVSTCARGNTVNPRPDIVAELSRAGCPGFGEETVHV